ncbi:hypothetical protein [Streptomyces sp. CAU 1734]|uniref:hypothetical protein n=1 Tax=Streptomyces sp. CAU 1734 TaxID=3140360 RepID=UPI00326065AC
MTSTPVRPAQQGIRAHQRLTPPGSAHRLPRAAHIERTPDTASRRPAPVTTGRATPPHALREEPAPAGAVTLEPRAEEN